MPDTCPLSARVAQGLAAPGAKLDAELSAHLPRCEACRCAAGDTVRRWPAESGPLAEWLRESPNSTTLTPYQLEAVASGTPQELEIGPYLILDLIARGGMGAVYRAWHRLLRREDAVKTVRAELATSTEAVRRFLREAEAAARLQHPNVVRVYTADRAPGGDYYIAMELVSGPDLSRVMKDHGPLPPDVARDYIAQAAAGLQSALDHGFVHRDVKPGNLLLAPGGVVKVADFGIARALDPQREDAPETMSGAILGTPAFMSPEQAKGERADTRADVYALGCTLFYLLAGRAPFQGTQGIHLCYAHVHEPVPEVPAPPALGAIVRKCLAKRAEDRYQTPGELATALRALDAPLVPTVVRPAPAPRPEPPAPNSSTELTQSVEALFPQNESRGPRPGLMIAAAVLALLLAATGAILVALLPPNPPANPGVKNTGNDQGAGAKTDDGSGASMKPVASVGTRAKVDPAHVPRPVAKKPGPWAFAGLVPASEGERVLAVGFLPNGDVAIGRDGGKAETARGAWEVWPGALGSEPLRFRHPCSDNKSAKPVFVHPAALVTDKFERCDPVTLEPLQPLEIDLKAFESGTAEVLDQLSASRDGSTFAGIVTLAGNEGMRARVHWDAKTGRARAAVSYKSDQAPLALGTDRTGRVTISATQDGWLMTSQSADELARWKYPQNTGPDPASAVAVDDTGGRAFSAHFVSGNVYVWNKIGTKGAPEIVHTVPVKWPIYRLHASPDGRWLVAAGDAVAAIDLSKEPPTVHTLAEHWAGEFRSVAFRADGSRVAVAGYAVGVTANPGVAWVWELK